ncbi:MAG TPA: diguanylate cyclase [Elusimicrobiota bacterium]|nr:diguanylate cyclase [Elusimicrobiota bacterium]
MDTDQNFHKNILDNLNEGIFFVDTERRITYWSKGAEHLTGHEEKDVLGKKCADILFCVNALGHRECDGRCLLENPLFDGQIHEKEFFLHHKEGYRTPVLVRSMPYRNANGKVIGAIEILIDNSPKSDVMQQIEALQKMVLLDPLTSLGNRGYGEKMISSKLAELQRHISTFGMLFIDIDHFKQINDKHGHNVGDRVLKMIAKTIMNNVRPFDAVCRWGGEEFIALILNVSDDQLRQIAEKIRILIEQSSFWIDADIIRVTVSVGATLALPGDTPESLVKRADELLYQSKAGGRNRVAVL